MSMWRAGTTREPIGRLGRSAAVAHWPPLVLTPYSQTPCSSRCAETWQWASSVPPPSVLPALTALSWCVAMDGRRALAGKISRKRRTDVCPEHACCAGDKGMRHVGTCKLQQRLPVRQRRTMGDLEMESVRRREGSGRGFHCVFLLSMFDDVTGDVM